MKKRSISMILAIAMVISIFAGITVTASAAEGSYVLADALAVGDTVILANASGTAVFTGISSNIGSKADVTPADGAIVSAEAAQLTVEAGSAEGSFAFKMADGKYLGWTGSDKSNNKLYAMDEITAECSWTVVITEGAAVVTNVNKTERVLQYNNGSPRFCVYTGSQADVSFYKLDENGCTHADATSEVVSAPTCTEAGITKYTCSCGYSWEVSVDPLGHNYENDTCTLCGDVKVVLAFEKVTTIAVGDEIVIVSEKDAVEMVSIGTVGTYGDGLAYTETGITGAMMFQVVAGASEGTFAFANNETYLCWKSGNALTTSSTIDAQSSWNVSFDDNGNAVMINASDDTRQLWWNHSSPRFACYAGKTEGTGFNSIQFYAVNDGSCKHQDATSEITTAATCTEAGVMTWTCSCGETWTTEIDALGHSYSISVVDGVAALVCATCGDSQNITFNTIAEAKAYTDKTVVYNVKGVVTYINGRTVYIEDENDGLCVYFATTFDTSALNLGDEIFVSSTMTTYSGLPELDGPATCYVLSNGNALPENTTVTLTELLTDTTNAYLGERVTIADLTVGTVNAGGSTSLTDKDGKSINLYKATGVDAIVSTGDVITLTAIVSTHNGYQLLVNPSTIANDILVQEQGGDVEIETVTIAEAKLGTTGTYYQVEGIVTAMSADMRTIYIQDTTGGIALYLNAKPAEAVCAVGDQVKARGSWKAYNGLIELTEIDAANAEFFQIISNGNVVEAQLVEIVDLGVDLDNEYLSEKVRIEGACITKIATNGTVTLSQNGTTITIYKAPALSEECVVGAIVNVTAVVSAFNGYQLLINEAADVEFVKACDHASVEVLEGYAATCTADGLTEGAKCKVCGTVTVAQEAIPATGHSETTTPNGDGTHTTACGNCGESSIGDCEYVDGVCSACGAKEPSSEPTLVEGIKLGHTLNLASDISINYGVLTTSVTGYENYYLECVVPTYSGNELTGSTTVKIQPVLNGYFYYFTLTGITAIQMNDKIEARLYMEKDGVSYVSTADIYSVGTYAYSQMDKTTVSESLKYLCADLLRYGAAAQTFKSYRTDALVDANMTDAHKAYLSDIDSVTFNSNKGDLNDFENPSIAWAGRALDLNSKVVVKFAFTVKDPSINVEDLTAKITYVNYKGETVTATVANAELYNPTLGYYAFSFDGLLAAELRAVLNCVVYNGETRLSSTSFYSVDTYANGKSGLLLDLCKALIAYSDTALEYFNSL